MTVTNTGICFEKTYCARGKHLGFQCHRIHPTPAPTTAPEQLWKKQIPSYWIRSCRPRMNFNPQFINRGVPISGFSGGSNHFWRGQTPPYVKFTNSLPEFQNSDFSHFSGFLLPFWWQIKKDTFGDFSWPHGCGSKLNSWGYTGFSLHSHLYAILGIPLLSHSPCVIQPVHCSAPNWASVTFRAPKTPPIKTKKKSRGAEGRELRGGEGGKGLGVPKLRYLTEKEARSGRAGGVGWSSPPHPFSHGT